MKGFVIPLLGVTLVLLLTYSIESVTADHLEPGRGIFNSENQVNLILDKDSKYRIHLIVEVRNAQGQLISVSETMDGKYLVHEITDYVFDAMSDKSDKKEITVIDNMKYQRIHLTQIKNVQQMTLEGVRYDDIQSAWYIEYCVEINEQCDWHIAFATFTSHISLEEDDVVTIHWTVLRAMN